MRPGRLPLGWKLSGGWDRDDSGQLDQRYQGLFGRLDLTLPVSPTLALVGGVGYEDIEVSYRPPLTNGAGQPVVDANGRFVTNNAAPRTIAFETDGLIYDAGVMWRPSRRLSAEARVGRRYGDMTYTGSLSYVASQSTGYQIGLYDGISTIGRSLSAGLSALPTDFTVFRNGVDGALGGCATPLPRVDRAAIESSALPGDAATPLGAEGSEARVDQVDAALQINPVCGFLLPDHLDESLEFFGADGAPLGELLHDAISGGVMWEIAAGRPGPADAGEGRAGKDHAGFGAVTAGASDRKSVV